MEERKKIKKRISRLSLLLLLSCWFSNVTYAQESVISGTVIDETGEPIPGVSIVVIGSQENDYSANIEGTTTDFDGKYTLKISDKNKNLLFSAMGFNKQIVPVGVSTTINITLITDVSQLDEVVVVGYGTQSRTDVTGAITKLDAEAIERTSNVSVEQALTGRIAGVNTIASDGSPGAGIRVRIRGGTSINANNEPLYVIDGLPIEIDYSISDGPAEVEGPSQSPLANLDPDNIKSIDVLKDASAAAIYGARGANGVVIITTKSGRSGKAEITFDTSVTTSSVPNNRFVNVLSTSDYGTLMINRAVFEDGIEHDDITFGEDNLTPEEEQARYDALPNTNWQQELYRTGIISKYALNASGGNDKNTYYIGGSYLKNEGAIINSHFKRYNFNVNLQNKLSDKLKVRTVLAPSYSVKQGPVSGGDFNQSKLGIVIRALTRRTDRGQGVVEDDIDSGVGVWVDPVTEAKQAQNYTNTFGFNGNTHISYEIAKGLTASIRLGANIANGKTKSYYTKEYGRGFLSNGIGTRYHYENLAWNNQNMLQYRTTFGNKNAHKLNVLGVFEQTYQFRETEYMSVKDFPVETLGFNALQNGLLPDTPETFTTETMLKSYLARVNYGYKTSIMLPYL